MILRLALAPSEEIERYRAWLRTLTFPSEDHLETEDLLELIMAERLGEPHAVEPVGQAILETPTFRLASFFVIQTNCQT